MRLRILSLPVENLCSPSYLSTRIQFFAQFFHSEAEKKMILHHTVLSCASAGTAQPDACSQKLFGLIFREDSAWAAFSLGICPFPNLIVPTPFSHLEKELVSGLAHVCLDPVVVSQPGVGFHTSQPVGGWVDWPRVWKKSKAGASGLGRALSLSQALTSKEFWTESICLRGKSQRCLVIIWILLASQGSDS